MNDAVARAFREERAIVLATLIRQAGDFQLAEDAVQDAFEAAVTVWQRDGVPANPGAWITTAARRRAIDRLRQERSVTGRAERLAELMRLDAEPEERDDERDRRRPAAAHLHLLPSGAGDARAGGAHAARARRLDDR